MQTTRKSHTMAWGTVLFSVLCALFLFAPSANAADNQLVGANIKDGQLLGYYGVGGDITIPNTVTTIGEEAFKGNDNVTSVTIPGSVSTIGYNAFEGCTELEAVYFPDSKIGADLTIRVSAFADCPKLKECTIPACAKYVTGNVFKGCSSLAKIKVDPDNPYYFTDEYGVLFGPWVDEGVPQYNDPVLSLNAYPCGREEGSYTIPETVHGMPVNQIWASSFRNARNLTSVEIPATCTMLGGNGFENTGLTSITIPDTVTSMGAGLLSHCENLTDVVINAPIVELEMSMFDGSSSLQRVTFPSTLRSLGMYVFRDCTSITSMILPEGINTLDSDIFDGCTNLQRVYIPASVLTFPSVDGMYFDPFEGTSHDLTVYVVKGSNGEKWATNHADEFGWNYETVNGVQQLPTLDVGTFSLVDMGKKVKLTGAFHMGDTMMVRSVVSGPQYDAFRNSTEGAISVYEISMANDAQVPASMSLGIGRPKGMGTGAKLYTLKGSSVTPLSSTTISGTLTAPVDTLGYFAVIDGESTGGEVDPTVPSNVKMNRTAASLEVGQKLQLSATVEPSTASDKSVTWETSSTAIAEVTQRGVVTGISGGTATITATTSNGLKATCKVTVTGTDPQPPVPTPTDSITTAAAVRVGTSLADGKAPFMLNLSDANRVATVEIQFETTGSGVTVTGQNGFTVLGNVNTSKQGSKITGSVMLCYLTEDQSLFTAKNETTIANLQVAGEKPSFKVTGMKISGWNDQKEVAYGTVTGINPNEATFTGPMSYDLNEDGIVDQLDITWAQMFYRAQFGDNSWNVAKRCDFNSDRVIDIMDFINILQHFTDLG